MDRLLYKEPMPQFTDTFIRMYPELRSSELCSKTVTFVVTQQCQLRCSYCYQHGKNAVNVMSKEVAKKAIDLLFEESYKRGGYLDSSKVKAIIIDFIGGEPLLEVDLIDYICEYFRYKAVSLNHIWALNHFFSISTNGVAYLEPKVQSLLRRNFGRMSIAITIDGNKELHDSCRKFQDGSGSYDIVESAMKHHLTTNYMAHTKLTLAPTNVKHLFNAVTHLFNLGLPSVFANCVFEKGWEVEHAKVFYNQLIELANYMIDNEIYKEHCTTLFTNSIGQPLPPEDNQNWCGGTGNMLAIDTNGEIYPCLRYVPFSLKEGCVPLTIGNIDVGIGAYEEHSCTICMLDNIDRRSQSTDECFNCPIASGCAWCSAYNYEEFGTADKKTTYHCGMHKARVLANVYYWNKLYRAVDNDKRFRLNIPKEWALEIISESEYDFLLELSKLE